MTARAIRIVIGIAVVLQTADVALACSCPSPGPPCEAAWGFDAIFSGTVRSIDQVSDASRHGSAQGTRVVKFDVDRNFKNTPGRAADVITDSLNTCDYRFQVGQRYVVYASKTQATATLRASICSRTRLFAEAREDLRYLPAMLSTPPGVRLFGRVTEYRRDPAEAQGVDYGPLEGVPVTVRGSSFMRETVTDAHGRYEVTNLPVGKATLSLFPPFGFDTRRLEGELNLLDARGCREVNYVLVLRAVASGRVVDTAGRAVRGIQIEAVAAELAGFDSPAFEQPVTTDERGAFTFESLPPGRYVFGLNLAKPQVLPRAGVPVYLPGTRIAREATVVELKAGDDKDVGVLVLPRR